MNGIKFQLLALLTENLSEKASPLSVSKVAGQFQYFQNETCNRTSHRMAPPLMHRSQSLTIKSIIWNVIKNVGIGRYLTSHPHMAGTSSDFEQAEYIRNLWASQGLDQVSIKPYEVRMSYPNPDKRSQVWLNWFQLTLTNHSFDLSRWSMLIPVLVTDHSHRWKRAGEIHFGAQRNSRWRYCSATMQILS